MTSAEKVAELRRAITAAVAGLDRESDAGEQVFAWLGVWQMIPGFVRRRITAAVAEQVPLELLSDSAALDDILGLLAGVAVELRSDAEAAADHAAGVIYRERARVLVEQVRSIGA